MPNSFPIQRIPKCMGTPKGKHIELKNTENTPDTVSTSFKIQCLNTTLRFVKDDTQMILKYPEMTVPQGQFVYSLIRQTDETKVETDVGFGYKSLYAPLLEALKTYSIKYKFIASYSETSNNTTYVIFEKVQKQRNNENNCYISPIASPNISLNTNETNDPSLLIKPRKSLSRIQNIIDSTPQKFQTKILQAILAFTEDTLRAGLTLYSLNEVEADFCFEVIRFARLKQNYYTFSEESLMFLRKISNALCELKDVKAHLGKLDKTTKLRFVKFEKVHLDQNNYINSNCSELHNGSNSGLQSRESSVSNSPRDRGHTSYQNISTPSETALLKIKPRILNCKQNKQVVIDDVEESFIATSLKTILDFTKDTLRASLMFCDAPMNEIQFFRNVIRFAKGKGEWASVKFSKNCTNLLKSLDSSLSTLKSRHLSVTMMETLSVKSTNMRNIKFVKIPTYQNLTIETYNPSDNHNESKESVSHSPRDRSIKETSSSLSVSVSGGLRDVSISKDSRKVLQNKKTNNSVGIDKRPSNTAIKKKDRAKSREGGLNNRKLKLLEAMSVPVQSDIAMKMMLGMGWDGGALGLRGEGITEPIIPALDLKSRAGLGHVKTAPNKNTKTIFDKNVRIALLQKLLQFVESEIPVLHIIYSQIISTKEIAFLKHVTNSFNLRVHVGLEFEKEKELVQKILEYMKRNPAFILSYHISDDDKKVTLERETDRERSVRDVVEKQPQPQTQPKNSPKLTHAEIAMQSRVTILLQILQFVKSEQTEIKIQFPCSLTPRQRKYIEDCIAKINQRNKIGITQSENDLFEEIANNMEKCYMDVNFDTDKMFILRKLYYKKRFYNSALDSLEDLDHSINSISEPTNVQNGEKYDEMINLANDNDVIVIECDEPTVVTSDHENMNEEQLLNSELELYETVNDKSLTMNLDITADAKTEEQELDRDIRELENAIMEADFWDKETVIAKMEAEEDEILSACSPSSKRSRSDSNSSDNPLKKIKLQLKVKTMCIVPLNYPEEKMSREKAREIQNSISTAIDNTDELPLLKCHGVKNGALVYSCHGENSFYFLENIVQHASDIKITKEVAFDEQHRYKMGVKINSFIDENEVKIFKRLELYNPVLNTSDWYVRRKEINCDFLVILVDIDDKSFEYIRDCNFSLFAGIDKAEFSIVWE